jgi:hypothetical protein
VATSRLPNATSQHFVATSHPSMATSQHFVATSHPSMATSQHFVATSHQIQEKSTVRAAWTTAAADPSAMKVAKFPTRASSRPPAPS